LPRPTHGGNLAWAAAIANCPATAILDFSASINPLGPPQSALAAIEQGLNLLSSYPNPEYSPLRACLAAHHQITPDWVLPGNGAAELLTWAAWELSQVEVTYLPSPGFADYGRALRTFSVPMKGYNLNCLEEGWKTPQQAGLILNNPHNPTGKLWPVAMILPYLEQFALVVVDEAFMDFLRPSRQESLIPWVRKFDNLIILRSLTKFYSLPGLRLGYVITHPERIKRWQQWRDPWAVNILAALAGEAVIKDRQFQQQTWDWLIPAREKLCQELASLPGFKPLKGAANFLLVETQTPSSQLQLELLRKHRILIRDCLSFPELGHRFFRIAVRTQAENQTLLRAISRVDG
jgi:L-threonine-O-3-phosphate decarboxylase